MAMILADRVQETTNTVGLGNVTLTGAASGGFRTFASVMSTGDTAPVAVVDPVNNIWEATIATMQSDGTLALSVTASSAGGAQISLASNGNRTMVMLTPTSYYLKNFLSASKSTTATALSSAGVLQFDAVHWTAIYRTCPRLPSAPAIGNTLLGFAVGPGLAIPSSIWSTILGQTTDVSNQNVAIFSRPVTTSALRPEWRPYGVDNNNTQALSIVEVSGYNSFSPFHGIPTSANGNDFNYTLPVCPASSNILFMLEWDDTYQPIYSMSAGLTLVHDFGSGDSETNHGAYMFLAPGTLSGQTINVSLTANVSSSKVCAGLVMSY